MCLPTLWILTKHGEGLLGLTDHFQHSTTSQVVTKGAIWAYCSSKPVQSFFDQGAAIGIQQKEVKAPKRSDAWGMRRRPRPARQQDASDWDDIAYFLLGPKVPYFFNPRLHVPSIERSISATC